METKQFNGTKRVNVTIYSDLLKEELQAGRIDRLKGGFDQLFVIFEHDQVNELTEIYFEKDMDGFLIEVPDNFTAMISRSFALARTVVPLETRRYQEVRDFMGQSSAILEAKFVDEYHYDCRGYQMVACVLLVMAIVSLFSLYLALRLVQVGGRSAYRTQVLVLFPIAFGTLNSAISFLYMLQCPWLEPEAALQNLKQRGQISFVNSLLTTALAFTVLTGYKMSSNEMTARDVRVVYSAVFGKYCINLVTLNRVWLLRNMADAR